MIREEQPEDIPAIRQLTIDAFRGRPYAGGDEQDVIDRLRQCGDLTLSLVKEQEDVITGQVTFSPAICEDGSSPWFALGPVSVLPDLHGQGVGGELIRAGLEQIAGLGALGCILTGDPNYYQRFGFDVMPDCCPPEEPGEYFQVRLLHAEAANARFTFHPAFYGKVS